MLPAGLEPHPDPGRGAALFVDWQSCSDGGDELLDPARGQYKEFFIVVNALLDGEEVTTCPYIWVDSDFALVRGWIQGFPKKLGQIDMTRSLRARLPGRGAHVRRHALGQRPPAGARAPSRRSASPRPGRPTTTRRSSTSATFPRLAAGRHGEPAVHELVRARSRDRSISPI